jgi:RNA polymerase sigma-70 factor (ECF subfamily)
VSEPSPQEARPAPPPGSPTPLDFEGIYEQFFDFVWRSSRRLGVEEAALDDAVQEVFVVVHRKLHEFQGRSSLRTWLFSITMRVASEHRRSRRRKAPECAGDPTDLATIPDLKTGPHESAARAEATLMLRRFLDDLDDDRRAVFILAEMEGLSAPEIAEATASNLNTVYARIRAARLSFEDAVKRHRARERGA